MSVRKLGVDELDELVARLDDEGYFEETELSHEQFVGLYRTLVSERERVFTRLRKNYREAVADSGQMPDEMDMASRLSDQATLFRLADQDQKVLQQIEVALDKVRRGTYGLCEGTGEPIGAPRLNLRPWTRYSIEFKEELERRSRVHAGRPRVF